LCFEGHCDEDASRRRVSVVLYELAPDEEKFYAEGAEEVEKR
jgi:hypothetical protein